MTSKYYVEYLEKQGVESWDAQVIHLLLERQYDVSKRVVAKLIEQNEQQVSVAKSLAALETVPGLTRKNLLDVNSKQALQQINSQPLPEIRNAFEIDSALQLKTLLPLTVTNTTGAAQTAGVLKAMLPPVIDEDAGPSDATQFAQQKQSKELQVKRVKLVQE